MRPCQRPLDPIDAEAVAAGGEPVFASDAADHAAECPSCGDLVRWSRSLSEALEGLPESAEPVTGLFERVTRLRPFSRRERRTYALWKTPILLDLGVGAAGVALLALPVLTASDQISIGAVALSPILGFARAMARWCVDAVRLAPAGLEGLSEGLRTQSMLGLVSLLLLIPAGMGLRRVLSGVRGRR